MAETLWRVEERRARGELGARGDAPGRIMYCCGCVEWR